MDIVVKRTRLYQAKADRLLSGDEQRKIETDVATSPDRWPVIRGTGGVRKMRAAFGGKGKSGGVRVCYFYRSHIGTVYLLTLYGKGEKADLTAADKKVLRELVKRIDQVEIVERKAR